MTLGISSMRNFFKSIVISTETYLHFYCHEKSSIYLNEKVKIKLIIWKVWNMSKYLTQTLFHHHHCYWPPYKHQLNLRNVKCFHMKTEQKSINFQATFKPQLLYKKNFKVTLLRWHAFDMNGHDNNQW